ncbi:MAG: hypothetical protein Q8P39_01505 [Candidatus Yanofskybacteria bacterium]|nr:hypothetical protein [Candidatus Yanofskybacteria bacterium]
MEKSPFQRGVPLWIGFLVITLFTGIFSIAILNQLQDLEKLRVGNYTPLDRAPDR